MKLATGFNSLTIVDHPLIEDKLTQMRDKATEHPQFKILLNQISHLMAFAVTSELPLKSKTIQTPLCEMHSKILANKPPVLVNILRAGLGMMQGLETILPHSPIGHIGVARDHITHEPHEYKVSLPKLDGADIILIDPMLATGHSAIHAVKVLLANGADATRIKFMCLVAAPEGVRAFENAFPNIKIFTAALDSHLDENKYIVPGLGDAGDRYFGT